MPTTRYRDGSASATISHDLAAWCRSVVSSAERDALSILEQEAEKIASDARQKWYTMVEKETGQSGQIDVVTTYDVGRGRISVAVGSLDSRVDPKSGKPTVVFIKSPGRNSTVKKQVSREEYYATPNLLRGNYDPFPEERAQGLKGPFVYEINPLAGSPKNLLQTLIKSPVRLKLKDPALLGKLKDALKDAVKKGAS